MKETISQWNPTVPFLVQILAFGFDKWKDISRREYDVRLDHFLAVNPCWVRANTVRILQPCHAVFCGHPTRHWGSSQPHLTPPFFSFPSRVPTFLPHLSPSRSPTTFHLFPSPSRSPTWIPRCRRGQVPLYEPPIPIPMTYYQDDEDGDPKVRERPGGDISRTTSFNSHLPFSLAFSRLLSHHTPLTQHTPFRLLLVSSRPRVTRSSTCAPPCCWRACPRTLTTPRARSVAIYRI